MIDRTLPHDQSFLIQHSVVLILLLAGCQATGWALPSRTSSGSLRGCGKVIKRYYLKQLQEVSGELGELELED